MKQTEVRSQRSEVRFAASLLLMLLLVIDQPAFGQAISLKTGQKVDTQGVRREGDLIMGKVQVGTGSGEIGYHLSQIAKIDFPEPRGLKSAADLMTQGQPQKAFAEIEPVVSFYQGFKEVPGSWWAQAALIKVSVLAALQREAEAESLAADIQKSVTDPETARGAQVRLAAGLIKKRQFEKVIAICDAAIKESADAQIVANAWLNKGDLPRKNGMRLCLRICMCRFFIRTRSLLCQRHCSAAARHRPVWTTRCRPRDPSMI
jgi:hypothetical protein